MNRAERRRTKTNKKEPVYNLTEDQIKQIKRDAVEEASNIAFKLLLCIPIMVIHDKYGQLMKKDGREERFADLIMDLYDSYDKGYVTLRDLEDCLKEETGITFEQRKGKRK